MGWVELDLPTQERMGIIQQRVEKEGFRAWGKGRGVIRYGDAIQELLCTATASPGGGKQ